MHDPNGDRVAAKLKLRMLKASKFELTFKHEAGGACEWLKGAPNNSEP